ncbi:MAG: T9SS type A sorting domain-containing protein [Candidatus Lokiarchaeota archaeon]|nr:T9SS type A sorting domain-containing protein [Candidatus Lokiarchaeota archaeon]
MLLILKLQIFDINGRLVKTLVNTEQQPGVYSVEWNARDDAGNPVTSGIYLYRLTAGNKVLNRKMILTK